ncbi:MAG: asparagine--tRNA ligase [Bdellovibrionales bacterium]|nr:asparagine--tRNA ligase [Bdellovibrionales bacterium]
MTPKTSINKLKNFEGQEVSLSGWVYQFRSSGKISFLVLRDGTGDCQCVFTEGTADSKSLEAFSKLSLETAVEVRGQVKKWKDSYELKGQDLKILFSAEPWPLGKKSHGVDFLMSHRHLWLRSKKQRAIMNVRNELIQNIHHFFQKEEFLHIDAPILAANACEGTSSLFSVNFFDQEPAYLSQSGQMYMEAAAAAYGKVYCFGPTFRAEKSSTRRHLLEFWMIEPEMAFCNLEEAMELAERFVEYVVQNTLQTKTEELKVLERNLDFLRETRAPFPRLSYKTACEVIQKSNPDFQPGGDFGGGEETLISSQYKKPVFVHHYPKDIKAFYMKEDEENPSLSLSFDLLATDGYGELIGGGQREDSLEKLEEGIREHHLKKEDFEWYLDLRRFGSFTHSGFGLGLERLVAWVCGLDHVRETIPFPRVYGRSFFEKSSSS